MLQNAHLLAKIGANTAENERNFAKNWQLRGDGDEALDLGELVADLEVRRLERDGLLEALLRHVLVEGAPGGSVIAMRSVIIIMRSVHGERANFTRPVLGCIEANFCNQMLILQYFSRYTRFANRCSASKSRFL